MGCCDHKQDHTHAHQDGAQKAEGGCCGGSAKKESCCKGSKIAGFFKMLLGRKCCGSSDCKS